MLLGPMSLLVTAAFVLGVVTVVWALVRRHFIKREEDRLLESMRRLPHGWQPPVTDSPRPIAVVTGGAGFLGQHVVQQLVCGGYYKTVRVFDMTVGAAEAFVAKGGARVEFCAGNILD